MSDIPARLRRLVGLRAGNQCEYCRLSQEGQEATFHIDHILPKSAGGRMQATNLALACVSCSLRKEARRSAIDPITNRRVALFHPRRQRWRDHFRWDGYRIVGLTPTGRVTVAALQMNRPLILAIRQEEAARGRTFEQ
ncbi:MAG: HNH endonuclease [Candidatus Binatia bacterium]